MEAAPIDINIGKKNFRFERDDIYSSIQKRYLHAVKTKKVYPLNTKTVLINGNHVHLTRKQKKYSHTYRFKKGIHALI